jgi:hypothetical protein
MLPELMASIEQQTEGEFNFRPPECEHAWCSFHPDYLVLSNSRVRAPQSSGKDLQPDNSG